jgi:signal transduction histidine kinase
MNANKPWIINPFEGSGMMIYGDSERLYQALHNVVSNAIKYTPDHGTITMGGRMLPGFVEITISRYRHRHLK